ncbi:MAG: hypothetical protein WCT07_02175 [Candidatus Paceibacterota bacterium]
MGYSIQEYLKIINSRVAKLDYISLLITTVFLVSFSFYLYFYKNRENIGVSYSSSDSNIMDINTSNQNPFASINGKTYTFSWCNGADKIKDFNKISFKTEEDAKNSGRTLSKLCQK